MTLGLGIFLSSLVFALILLYALTRARWNWHRIVRYFIWSVSIIICVVGVSICGVYIWQQLPNSPSIQVEYMGLRLGMTKDEVKYAKGIPTHTYKESVDEVCKGCQEIIEIAKLKAGEIDDYNDWGYKTSTQNRIDVAFDKRTKLLNRIECYSYDRLHRCDNLGGIQDGDDEQKLLRTFGKTNTSRLITGPDSSITKNIKYDEFKTLFHLEKGAVYMLGIFDNNNTVIK